MAINRYIGGKSTWIATEGNIDIVSIEGSVNLSSNQCVKLNGYNDGILHKNYDWKIADNNYERYGPWLILHSAKKKGRNEKDTGTAMDMLYNDYPENLSGLAKLKEQLRQENINVELEKKKKDTFPLIKPSDEDIKKRSNSFAEDRMENIKPFLKKTDKELFDIFRNDIKSYSMGDLEDVAIDMVNKMQANKGGEYSHKNINYASKNHHSFVDFANELEFYFADEISKGKKLENFVTTMETPVKNHFFYNILKKEGIKRPQFSDYYDALHGLKILTNDIWAYEVRVLEYYKNSNILSIDLQYNLYDHFGLDYPDIQKFDQEIFYAWFVLQHFRGYKPLLTNIEIKRTYRMIVSEKW